MWVNICCKWRESSSQGQPTSVLICHFLPICAGIYFTQNSVFSLVKPVSRTVIFKLLSLCQCSTESCKTVNIKLQFYPDQKCVPDRCICKQEVTEVLYDHFQIIMVDIFLNSFHGLPLLLWELGNSQSTGIQLRFESWNLGAGCKP